MTLGHLLASSCLHLALLLPGVPAGPQPLAPAALLAHHSSDPPSPPPLLPQAELPPPDTPPAPGQSLTPRPPSCVTVGKLLNLSETPIPLQENEVNPN